MIVADEFRLVEIVLIAAAKIAVFAASALSASIGVALLVQPRG